MMNLKVRPWQGQVLNGFDPGNRDRYQHSGFACINEKFLELILRQRDTLLHAHFDDLLQIFDTLVVDDHDNPDHFHLIDK